MHSASSTRTIACAHAAARVRGRVRVMDMLARSALAHGSKAAGDSALDDRRSSERKATVVGGRGGFCSPAPARLALRFRQCARAGGQQPHPCPLEPRRPLGRWVQVAASLSWRAARRPRRHPPRPPRQRRPRRPCPPPSLQRRPPSCGAPFPSPSGCSAACECPSRQTWACRGTRRTRRSRRSGQLVTPLPARCRRTRPRFRCPPLRGRRPLPRRRCLGAETRGQREEARCRCPSPPWLAWAWR